jgi:hemerythrin superfamily protein
VFADVAARGKKLAAPKGMKTTETIDVLEILTEQHDLVDQLISEVRDADDVDTKAERFIALADEIAAHAYVEEHLFYPSVVADDTCAQLLEATEEHLAIKRVLADLLELAPDDDRFDAKLVVLAEEIRHHARDEEEGKLFPLVRELFDEDERAGLGNELLVMYEQQMAREPRKQVPSETGEAAPLEMIER